MVEQNAKSAARTAWAVAFSLGAFLAGPVAAAPVIGEAAPAFSLPDTRGDVHSLDDFAGRTVVLEWTNHDCPYVRKHYDSGNMQATQRDAREDGVVWLSVISSKPGSQGHVSPARADELTESRDAAPTAVLLDPAGDVGRAYAARTTPHMYVIDGEGRLVYMGGIDDRPTSNVADIEDATNYVREALAALEAGEAVDPAVTRPYGCSVKY
ncbi:MAG: redoxin domain-containing protein [Pseudomonadales bacterium]|jgi:peroxiredoxin|nr:redoxin domain-containing protein [Pseudomonadales bacterium]